MTGQKAEVVVPPVRTKPKATADRSLLRINCLKRVYRRLADPASSAAAVQLASELGFVDISELADPNLLAYVKKAADYQAFTLKWVAENVGQGECGPGPASILATAALQLAASRFAFEKLGNIKLFSRLGDASARNLALAHELCAREAACRPREGPHALLAALQPEGGATGGAEQASQGDPGVPVPGGQSGSGKGQAEGQASEAQCLEVEGQAVEGGK